MIKLYALLIILFISTLFYFRFAPVISRTEGYTYYLQPGTSKYKLATELNQQEIATHPILLVTYLYAHKGTTLKTGEYHFKKGSTLYSIAQQILYGYGLNYRPFTIVPGWTFKQVRAALDKTIGLRHLITSLSDQQIMERFGYTQLSPEGEFFPETYNYTRNDVDLVILKRAFDLMQSKLNEAWQTRAAGLPYKNSYEALIAASMIEKEGYLDMERPVIAGVLVNRLKKDMLLQIDATVIYGLGDRYKGKIYKENLLENTLYNTYVHRGLPPTPIAMPGLSSLQAATHPQQNNYYYYVAKGNGGHQFSTTLQAHHEAVQTAIEKMRWIRVS
jgi:UPF0755 protein